MLDTGRDRLSCRPSCLDGKRWEARNGPPGGYVRCRAALPRGAGRVRHVAEYVRGCPRCFLPLSRARWHETDGPGMGSEAKRHHVVSKFYLRYFADEAERITTVMLPGGSTFPQNIKNASVQTRFYTAIGNDGQPTDAAETAFSKIEAAASVVWREVCAGVWPLSADAREHMAGWIALQLLRGSRVRRSMSQLGTDMLQLQVMVGGRRRLREVLRDLGEPHDDESVTQEWISLFEDPLEVEVHANHHLQYLTEALPRITRSLLDRWWLLTTFERKGLATSDHPVYVLPNPDLRAIGMGTGIENADAIHVPLTRRHSLSLHLRATLPNELAGVRQDRRISGVAATALYSNSCTVNSARRMLFHHPEDAPLQGLDLPDPRTREIEASGDPWCFMPDEDRQVLLDAGLQPPGSRDEGITDGHG